MRLLPMPPWLQWSAALATAWARWAPPGGLLLALLCSGLMAAYSELGEPKPMASWQLLDIAGEGGSALMAGIWCVMVLGSRPRGRVTTLLAGGLGMIALGNCADCLDEFYRVSHEAWWDNVVEAALMPGGMLVLTLGLLGWRKEQMLLSEHLRQRERLYRDHRGFDRVTQLADAGYLRQLVRVEQREHPDQPCALLMLDAGQLSGCLRVHGPAESDRLLQALTHLLLLNLRATDVLCRYAGDRFAVLLPATAGAMATQLAAQLRQAVASLSFHTRDGQLIEARVPQLVLAEIDGEEADPVDALVAALNRRRQASPS
ncbi:MAG TPA: GGDEF domain-containing protein [Ideonella sp.]|uniref:GGDEF domain-containing protein n=1 Tax=Ideonella sp. TaxID=1929293 RepID=UPI002E3646B3|nr:GGDEF domain-containing protein [Ideonella sp.]HEX5683093.1 GGDEF domain-containing protein [Ideonella sp.]